MGYTLTTNLQISGVDSASTNLPAPVRYAASLITNQTVAQPGRERYTITTTAQTITLAGQGTTPIVAASGSVPRVRCINTSSAGSVSLVSSAFLILPTTPSVAPVSILLGPGAIIDLAFAQLYNQPLIIQPAEAAWTGTVPASAAVPVVVDVLFL